MRIISGIYKGKKILLPKDNKTRPLRDLVKESIFNLITHSKKISLDVNNINILDLFCGTGSFGIECLSRGARNVFFIENYSEALDILKKNLLDFDTNKFKIIEKNCFTSLPLTKNYKNNFQIIFIDPPYKEEKINIILEQILEKKILSENGVIIIHRHKKDNVILTKKFNILDTRIYGLSKIIFGN